MPLGERSSESSAADHAAHPLFARFYDRLSARAEDRGQRRHREALLAGLSGRVLEVGAGNGLNFGHYPQSVTEVLAVEPEPFLRARALEAAEHVTVNVHVLEGSAEALPRDDGSCDAAVASLVLCSVADQAAALTEMWRVLRAGGELRFYEHVAAGGRAPALLQQLADRTVWPRIGGGCHLHRDTAAAIEAAGFTIEACERFAFAPMRGVSLPHIRGIARKA